MGALEKGILYICNKYKNYKELNVNNRINQNQKLLIIGTPNITIDFKNTLNQFSSK